MKLVKCLPIALLMMSKFALAAGSEESATLTIAANTPLSVKLLDEAWTKRENLANQKVIADYLLTKPAVPNDYETAWKTARLVLFIGNFGRGEKEFVATSTGAKLFDYGADAGKLATKLNARGVEGYYWYASDLGSYGLAKGIMSAASSAGAGMDALRQAYKIDPSYQWYGSSRVLGRYYQELPGLFGGSNKKALAMLTEATEKAPTYRNNWLFLGRFYLSTGDNQNALNACQKAITLPSQDGKYEEMRYLREAEECVAKAKAKLS